MITKQLQGKNNECSFSLKRRMNEIIKGSNDCCSDILFRISQPHLESFKYYSENGKGSEVYDVFPLKTSCNLM